MISKKSSQGNHVNATASNGQRHLRFDLVHENSYLTLVIYPGRHVRSAHWLHYSELLGPVGNSSESVVFVASRGKLDYEFFFNLSTVHFAPYSHLF